MTKWKQSRFGEGNFSWSQFKKVFLFVSFLSKIDFIIWAGQTYRHITHTKSEAKRSFFFWKQTWRIAAVIARQNLNFFLLYSITGKHQGKNWWWARRCPIYKEIHFREISFIMLMPVTQTLISANRLHVLLIIYLFIIFIHWLVSRRHQHRKKWRFVANNFFMFHKTHARVFSNLEINSTRWFIKNIKESSWLWIFSSFATRIVCLEI